MATLDRMSPEAMVASGSPFYGVLRQAAGQLVARPDGHDWVLSGQKPAWVSNAPIATHALLNLHLEPNSTLDRGVVPVATARRREK